MGTSIRPEISESNEYHISKHRYYELKHFCLQYREWKRLSNKASEAVGSTEETRHAEGTHSNPTYTLAVDRMLYRSRIDLVETAASLADPDIAPYILEAVTEGLSYPQLKARLDVPCGKDMFYDRYRRFFSILDLLKTRSERRAV